MVDTARDYRGRHWVTHTSEGMSVTACGRLMGQTIYPPVPMPSALIDCSARSVGSTKRTSRLLTNPSPKRSNNDGARKPLPTA